MSHFYGTLQGCAGRATRRGHKSSGLEVAAASWAGAIRVTISHDETTGEDTFYIAMVGWQGKGDCAPIAKGIIGQANTIVRL